MAGIERPPFSAFSTHLPHMQRSIKTLAILLTKNGRLVLTLLLAATLVGGIIYSLILGDTIRFLPDEADYIQLAKNLSARQMYTLDGVNPTAYRAPGYPTLLAGLMVLGAEIVHFRMANYLLLIGNLWLVYKILNHRGARLGAIIGVLMATAYPVVFFSAGTLYPQVLAAFLFLLAIHMLTQPALTPWSALVGGLLLGCLTLTIPIFLFTLGLIPAWLWYSRRGQTLRYLVLVIIAAFIPLALWTYRNYVVFKTFVPLTLNTGENLFYGNSPETTPNAGTTVDIWELELATANFTEVNRNRYYQERALNYIRRHPVRAAQMYALKFLNYFNFRNRLETSGESSLARDLLMLLTYGFILATATLRLVSLRRLPITEFDLLLVSLYLLSGLSYAIFFTRIRFRLPFDYLLILLAAPYLENILAGFTQQSASP